LAAGDRRRAARGWLTAGRTARHRAAFEDAVTLLDRALDAADEPALRAAIRLERSRAHEALAGFDAAFADADAALVDARDVGELRLEMRALQMRGGDAAVALGRPVEEATSDNAAGLALAARLGDRVAASRFRTRLVVLGSSRLQFADAEELALRGVAEARSVGSPEALARSLDGLKSVYAFIGDVERLEVVIAELHPILVDLRLIWLLQWTVLESSLIAAARGDWARALSRVDEALTLNSESGYAAYAGFFRAQRAWLNRMAGDLDGALADGRVALRESSAADHPWWYAAAAGGYATTLLEAGARDEAAEVAGGGLSVLRGQAGEAYRLRCLAPLVAATGQRVAEADALLAGAATPAGTAWISGSDVYDAVAAAWHGLGEPERAEAVLAPLVAATGPDRWAEIHRRARQRSSASS
ncbi:MAG: hypothetical protein WBP61_06950, partial [Nocardioides sp.]